MEYSENFLRGLSNDNCISDGEVTSAAFQFKYDGKFVKNGWAALSICWEDNDSVIVLMLQQKQDEQDDHFQFKAGVARFQRESIDTISKLPAFRGIVSYEREHLDNNPYHGNLLVHTKSSKRQRKVLPALIAIQFSDIIPRD